MDTGGSSYLIDSFSGFALLGLAECRLGRQLALLCFAKETQGRERRKATRRLGPQASLLF